MALEHVAREFSLALFRRHHIVVARTAVGQVEQVEERREVFGATVKVSRFTQALIEALSGYEAEAVPDGTEWIVTGSWLASLVSKILEVANAELKPEKHQHVEQQLIGSQPFHIETTPPRQIAAGIPSSWAASPQARQLLAKWGVAGIMPKQELEPLAEKREARQGRPEAAAGASRALSARDYFDVVLPVMLGWKGEAVTALNKRARFSLLDSPSESWTLNLEPPVATVTPNGAAMWSCRSRIGVRTVRVRMGSEARDDRWGLVVP